MIEDTVEGMTSCTRSLKPACGFRGEWLNQYLGKRILSLLLIFVQGKCSYLNSTKKCFLLSFLSAFGLAYYEASLNCLFIVYFTTSLPI
jgi:hypothetical protein